ncbi:MAG TPA: hypothetical protein VFY71_00240 [Planctomycetota bacterium]|nr:hypothetical protein [Planctomycetota bacterium]
MTDDVLGPLLAALAALLVPLLLGRQVVRALAGRALAEALGRAGEWAFGFGAGVTLVSVALGVAYAARLPAPGAVVAALALAAWGVLAWRARRRASSAGTAAFAAACSEPPSGPLARGARCAGWLLLAALVAGVGVASWRAAAGFPDTYLVWQLRGKVLYLDQGFGGWFWRSWTTAHDNRSYPPLISLATAWIHEATRSADVRAAKLLSAAFFTALLAVAHGVLRRVLGRGAALALTLALAGCTTLVMLGLWGIADLPMACQVLCAGALLLLADETLLLRLLAFPVAGAVLTKNEGLPVALAIAAACALRLLLARGSAAGLGRRVARSLGCAAAILAPAALLLGAWWALCASLGLPLQFMKPEAGVATSASRGQLALYVAHEMGARVADPSWLPGWIAFAVMTLLLAGRMALRREVGPPAEARSRCLAAATVVILTGLAYTWVLSGYQGDLPYLLRLSAGRLVAHTYPLALVVAACGAAALAGPRAPG